jgi:glycosyltransferase
VDGGSTDRTIEIVRRYERPGLRWISESDSGMYDAMNKGLHMATGACIGILNSDDWLEPGALADVASCFNDPECDYTYGDVYLASPEGERYGLMASIDLRELGKDYRYKMPFPHQSFYITRRLLDCMGLYSLNYRLSADHDFVVRVIESGAKGARLPRPIATYRMGGLGGGARTFQESRSIAIEHGMGRFHAYRHYVSSLAKVYLANSLPRPLVRVLMRLKGGRHTWY